METGDKVIRIIKAGKELKPCPFCDSSEIYYRAYEYTAGERWQILCSNCMCKIDPGTVQDRGLLDKMWNTRVVDK